MRDLEAALAHREEEGSRVQERDRALRLEVEHARREAREARQAREEAREETAGEVRDVRDRAKREQARHRGEEAKLMTWGEELEARLTTCMEEGEARITTCTAALAEAHLQANPKPLTIDYRP